MDRFIETPAVFAQTNVMGVVVLLNAVKIAWEKFDGPYGVKKYVQVSTDEVYGSLEYVEDRKGHDRRYGIAPDKIKADLGWYPETKFEDGISLTIGWYLAHQEWMNNVVSGVYQDYSGTFRQLPLIDDTE